MSINIVNFSLGLAAGGTPVDMSKTVIVFSDETQLVTLQNPCMHCDADGRVLLVPTHRYICYCHGQLRMIRIHPVHLHDRSVQTSSIQSLVIYQRWNSRKR